MKKCYITTIKMLLCAAIFCGLMYGLAATIFAEPIVEWRIARLEAALEEANPKLEEGGILPWLVDSEGLSIISLGLDGLHIADITPLRGVPLEILSLSGTNVSDLTSLKGMPLEYLDLDDSKVTDIAPLRGMPLTVLYLSGTSVTDLTPLKGMRLIELDLDETEISDLAPLKGMPLKELLINNTPASEKPLPKWLDPKIVKGHVGPPSRDE